MDFEKLMHLYKARPRKDKRGVDLISDALPFGRLWYAEPNAATNAVDFAKFYSRSHDAADSRLRCRGQCGGDARARGRVQRVRCQKNRLLDTEQLDRKSTRLNSSHRTISYAV